MSNLAEDRGVDYLIRKRTEREIFQAPSFLA